MLPVENADDPRDKPSMYLQWTGNKSDPRRYAEHAYRMLMSDLCPYGTESSPSVNTSLKFEAEWLL